MLAKFLETCDYENGYQQALLDVKNWFEHHSIALKSLRMYNQKNIEMLLNVMCKNAETFQKQGEDMDIYFDNEKKKITSVRVKK